MSERYEPASEFLGAVIADEVPLSGDSFADANLHRLIDMMHDPELSNRDWATMLLAQQDIDTSDVRAALLLAANDRDNVVRAEALSGLARRDRQLALPLVRTELQGEVSCMALFEAAMTIADPALVPFLLPWAEPSDNDFLDRLALDALAACESGKAVA